MSDALDVVGHSVGGRSAPGVVRAQSPNGEQLVFDDLDGAEMGREIHAADSGLVIVVTATMWESRDA